jgi:hypothetical protein
MNCKFHAICPFFLHRIPIHDAMYKTNVAKYCDGDPVNCALYVVIEKKSFLQVPKDLYPNQTFRLKQIMGS